MESGGVPRMRHTPLPDAAGTGLSSSAFSSRVAKLSGVCPPTGAYTCPIFGST